MVATSSSFDTRNRSKLVAELGLKEGRLVLLFEFKVLAKQGRDPKTVVLEGLTADHFYTKRYPGPVSEKDWSYLMRGGVCVFVVEGVSYHFLRKSIQRMILRVMSLATVS